MDGKNRGLRKRWRQRAEAAYRRMFEGKSQEELVTLTQRETLAVAIGKELAAFLLEEHVARDSAEQAEELSTSGCPRCGQPGDPEVQEGEESQERSVMTRAGEISIRRRRCRCRKCRLSFFSA